MKKYNCEYRGGSRLNIGDKWQMKIEAANPKEAYEKFIEKVGRYPEKVIVDIWWGLHCKIFDDHIEAEKQRILEEEKTQTGKHPQESADKKNVNFIHNIAAKTPDSDIEYQESGWATFLNICGVLNLILFVIGGIWLLNASSSEQFIAMNLTIIGLVATINSFFFAFLVNTFTRIQHNTHLTQINTHQTTLELKKLNNKNESKD